MESVPWQMKSISWKLEQCGHGSNFKRHIVIDNKGSSTIVNEAITEAKISRASVTYSKIQYVTPNTILGRTSEGAGSVEEIALLEMVMLFVRISNFIRNTS
jgi:hypothetical protein